jgi:SAM-dependent methyltransferase
MLTPTLKSLVPYSLRRWLRTIKPLPTPDYARYWPTALKWCLGDARLSADRLDAHGWLIATDDLRPHVEFRINGQPVERADYPLDRRDVEAAFPFAEGSRMSGFAIRAIRRPGEREWTLTAHNRQTGRWLGPDYAAQSIPDPATVGPLPDAARRFRVMAGNEEFLFTHGGLTAFRQLDAALFQATGKRLRDFPRILDWGCGSARVARYLLREPGVTLTGADVDADNVNWCRENLPQASWETIPLRPPTTFAEGSFDAIYGISVMTHLVEADQTTWLRELHRLTAPGGFVLLTFHGDSSLAWSRLSGERYAQLRRTGFCDLANVLYDASLDEADYYRDVYQTIHHVRRVWGEFFEIVAHAPATQSHQDLVVLRRR